MEDLHRTAPRIWKHGTLTYTAAGLAALFFWLLWGDFTWAMKDRAVGPSATLLIKSFGVSDFIYALVIVAFPNFTNIFLCPIISYISDRHRGKWGRRIPFLLFTTPFIVAGLIGLGFTPMLGNLLHSLPGIAEHLTLEASQLIVFGLFWVLLDFGTTLAGALSGALINDVVPTEMLGRFFALFRAISLIAGMLFNFYLLGRVEAYGAWIFTGIGLLYGIGLLSLCLKVREGEYPPVEPASAAKNLGGIFAPILTYFRQSFSISYYRWVILAMVFGSLAAAPFNIFSIPYAKSFDMNMKFYGALLTLTYAISLVISYFLGMLADRFHPLRTSLVSLVAYLFAMAAGWIAVTGPESFGVVLVIHGVISGCYFTLSASLGQRLFPKSLFAQFSSAIAMILAVTNVAFAPLLGKLLDRLDHDYRYVFLFGCITTLAGILALYRVYRSYLACGGDAAYRPPDPGD